MKGAWGEKAARLYLEKRGWHTAATNFRTRFGEIDIIAENAQYVIFAEVKTRKNARYGPACEAVTPAKQAKIIVAAQAWLQEHPTEKQPRFDVSRFTARKTHRFRRASTIWKTPLEGEYEAV